jgi:hypothetical protein
MKNLYCAYAVILALHCLSRQSLAFFHTVYRLPSCSAFDLKDTARSSIDAKVEMFKNMTFYEKTGFGTKRSLRWDDRMGSFSTNKTIYINSITSKPLARIPAYFMNTLRYTFLPGGNLTKDYFVYTSWRILQRFLSATTSVFGTQSLLLALGVKQSKIGLAAATAWVLKDALGKFSRIYWASKNGKLFDSDAKRWRFRSALLFAFGSMIMSL